MSQELLQELISLPPNATPSELLGISDSDVNADAVWKALEARLSILDVAPRSVAGRAEEARRRLYEAARNILDAQSTRPEATAPVAAQRRPARTESLVRPRAHRDAPVQLTEFDREVMAVLAASGGWNKESRERLTEIAARYGVSGRGLLMVVGGLSEYLRGEHQRHAGEAGETHQISSIQVQQESAVLRAIDEVQSALSRELKHGGPRTTVRLSIFFGGLTLLVSILIVVAMMKSPGVSPAPKPRQRPQVVEREETGTAEPAPVEELEPEPPTPPTFATYPTFQWPVDNAEARAAVAQAGTMANELDAAARRLHGVDDPSPAIFREWSGIIDTIGQGWVLLERTQRDRLLTDASIAFVYAEDHRPVVARLLEALNPAPPAGSSFSTWAHGGLWRSAFKAGVLGDLARRREFSAQTSEAIATAYASAVRTQADQSTRFEIGSGEWLDRWLAQVEIADSKTPSPMIFDAFEQWITAQRAIRSGEPLQESFCRAIDVLLASPHDVSVSSPWQDVLGRLVQSLDYRTSPQVRDHYRDWVSSSGGIDPVRSSVLTALIHASGKADWYAPAMVVAPNDSTERREAAANLALAAWPGGTIPVMTAIEKPSIAASPEFVKEFADGVRIVRAQAREDASAAESLRRLALATTLNAAADAVEQGLTEEADESIQAVLAGDLAAVAPTGTRPLGQPVGEDGEWAKAYQETPRNHDARLQALRMLRTRPAGDLGPKDAEVFVNEVYRASSPELRSVAQSLLLELFTYGPVVNLELLDQFSDAPSTQDLSQTIARLTGQALPSDRDTGWSHHARLALEVHALALYRGDPAMDLAVNAIDRSMRRRTGLDSALSASPLLNLVDQTDPTAMARAAADALRARFVAWPQADATLLRSDPLADERRRTTRRRLAEGPIQQFVAEQSSALEWFGLLAANERRSNSQAIELRLATARDLRRRARGALQQALVNELAYAEIMALRLGIVEDAGAGGSLSKSGPDHEIRRAAMIRTQADDPIEVWNDRLEKLDPSNPEDYFVLAEDIAASQRPLDPSLQRLAFACAARAGILAPSRLGRSACLLCAELADSSQESRMLRAMAGLLDRRSGVATSTSSTASPSADAVDGFVEALSNYRRGKGQRSQSLLIRDGVMDLVNEFGEFLPGGVNGFLTDIKAYRGQSRPAIRPAEIRTLLLIEIGLLAGDDRPWASDLIIHQNEPLVELDPARLDLVFNIEPNKTVYRGGWVAP